MMYINMFIKKSNMRQDLEKCEKKEEKKSDMRQD